MFKLVLDEKQIERLLEGFKRHTRTLDGGDHLIEIGRGIYDLFCGQGWSDPVRFRIVHYPAGSNIRPHFVHISGPDVTPLYRVKLLKELS